MRGCSSGSIPRSPHWHAALLLGQREGIEPEVNDAFARTGTTHLLAISGLQLQALAFALLVVFRVAGVGSQAGVSRCGRGDDRLCRRGRAGAFGRAGDRHDRDLLPGLDLRRLNRPANTLALAALGTLAVNPSYLFDVGCQLSFLAIGALIWLVPPAAAFVRTGIGKLRSRLLGP